MLIDLVLKVLEHAEAYLARRDLYAQLFMSRIERGDYVRYEKLHARRLKAKLPIGQHDDEDVDAMVRVFACEAAYRFDPDKRNPDSFDAFLYAHVMHRCMQVQQRAWRPKHYPYGIDGKPCWIRNEASWNAASNRGAVSGNTTVGSIVRRKGKELGTSDEPGGAKEFSISCIPVNHQAKSEPVVLRISPRSQELFQTIASDDSLIELASKPHGKLTLSKKLNVPREDVELMFNEVLEKCSL